MASVEVYYMGDGISPSVDGRCRTIASRIPSTRSVFVYGGDVYPVGAAADFVLFDGCYGDSAASQTPPGQNLLATMMHTFGNHEYMTHGADLRPTDADAYYLAGSPARTTRSFVNVDLTKSDPTAAYTASSLSSADAQLTAASQWGHLKSLDINGWRLISIDTGRANSDNGAFPTAGSYRAAVQALVDGATYRKLIVFGHHPKFTSGSVHAEPRPELNPLWEVISPKALLYISGHVHNYERQNARSTNESVAAQQPHGCAQICCGTAGTSLNGFVTTYGTPAASAFKIDTVFGFTKLTLNASTVDLQYYSLASDGLGTPTIIDSRTFSSAPPPQTITVTNPASGASMPWTASTVTSWLAVTPTSGGVPGTISVSADPTGMAVGNYSGSVAISASGATNTPVSVPVTLSISATGSTLSVGNATLSDVISPASDLRTYVGNVTAAGAGQRRFDAKDDGVTPFGLDTIKIIDDPTGGYLGFYHHLNTVSGRFEGYVASSTNLLTWHRETQLGIGWHQLTATALSDGGILVAGEADVAPAPGNWIKLRRYASRAALITGSFTHEIDLPHTMVPPNQLAEGTPNIYSVSNPVVTQATIDIGFHYFQGGIADRQARGTLTNWNTGAWVTAAQPQIDNSIMAQGVAGNIGDRDSTTFEGRQMLLVEGMGTLGSWATWRLYVYDPTTRTAQLCPLTTPNGTVGGANPTITRVKHPTIAGRFVRVMTIFIPTEVAGTSEAGELIFYKDSA